MKKVIAVLLAITMPIWYFPVALIFILAFAFSQAYESMLELLNYLEKRRKK